MLRALCSVKGHRVQQCQSQSAGAGTCFEAVSIELLPVAIGSYQDLLWPLRYRMELTT